MKYKRCSACWMEHPVTSFYKDPRKKNWLRAECKECYKYRQRMYNRRRVIEVQAPKPRVNVWEWIKRLFG